MNLTESKQQPVTNAKEINQVQSDDDDEKKVKEYETMNEEIEMLLGYLKQTKK